ncbi:helix-turn-helix domain-containing protein [Aeromicrobium sp. Leaf350]|uniref:helix-turn-helix domain-containing protein n=1 Tax=Aeromicrobium sp. Leaf350 TaxID=2876565 RepID=UPI001E460382|nr:helix-turn-helix domain-containing protein [Aeromicrobium sp. Leaf350]
MSDFRSDRMPSAEGRGIARQAWEAYERQAHKILDPGVRVLFGSYAANKVADLIGFAVVWQLEGGFEGLEKLGMSRASIYRKIAACRKYLKMHPDEFDFPGLTIDFAAYREHVESTRAKATPDDD